MSIHIGRNFLFPQAVSVSPDAMVFTDSGPRTSFGLKQGPGLAAQNSNSDWNRCSRECRLGELTLVSTQPVFQKRTFSHIPHTASWAMVKEESCEAKLATQIHIIYATPGERRKPGFKQTTGSLEKCPTPPPGRGKLPGFQTPKFPLHSQHLLTVTAEKRILGAGPKTSRPGCFPD